MGQDNTWYKLGVHVFHPQNDQQCMKLEQSQTTTIKYRRYENYPYENQIWY